MILHKLVNLIVLQNTIKNIYGEEKSMVKDHLENEYESIIEMCKAYSINPSTYKFRISSGMSVEDALLMHPLRTFHF